MFIIVLIILGFFVARYTSLIMVFAVGFALFFILIAGAMMLAQSEVPPVAETMNVVEFYTSVALTGVSGVLMIGFALAAMAYVLGAYLIGAIAGRITSRLQEQKS